MFIGFLGTAPDPIWGSPVEKEPPLLSHLKQISGYAPGCICSLMLFFNLTYFIEQHIYVILSGCSCVQLFQQTLLVILCQNSLTLQLPGIWHGCHMSEAKPLTFRMADSFRNYAKWALSELL